MANDQTPPAIDWSLFGPPVFKDPSARALSRVGVVDIGSNSVRLVVFDGAARSPAYFFNEKVMCGLGAGLPETGRLNPEGRVRAEAAMARFNELAKGMEVTHLVAVATAAVREATDGPDFIDAVKAQTGIQILAIDGQEEARLSAQGVLLGWPGAYGLVCDIGGSSMELAEINDGIVGKRVTSGLGPLKLKSIKGGKRGRRAYIKGTLDALSEAMGPQSNRLFLVGGSWRAIASIDMYRRNYPLHVLHEYRLTAQDVRDTIKLIENSDHEELRQACGISGGRMALVPLAADVLRGVVSTFRPHDIAISSYGLREGLLYEQMPPRLRARDPLIEACRHAEDKDARLPGFGKRLFEFVRVLFPKADHDMLRMMKAACLMHDINWRAHPDYRGEVCFDAVTRANLGGLKHRERVFLGLALMYRYRNKPSGTRFEALCELLTAKQLADAETLGKAMRLGAIMWAQPRDIHVGLNWVRKRKTLVLEIDASYAALLGEATEARLTSLAQAIGATSKVKLT